MRYMELHDRQSLLRQLSGANGVAARDGRQAAESLGEVTCRSGCANCCYSKIITDVTDGIGIYLYLRSEGRWTPEFRQRLVEADRGMTEHTHLTWAQKRVPCPFLDEKSPGEGVCSVYPVRPLGCSMTFSVGGDPKKCAELGEVEGGQIQIMIRSPSMMNLMMKKMMLGARLGEAYTLNTLPGAVLIGEAIVEGMLLPDDVYGVPYDMSMTEPPGHTAQAFDSVAKVR